MSHTICLEEKSVVNRKLAGLGKDVVRKMKVNKPSVNRGGLAAMPLPHHIYKEAVVLFTGNGCRYRSPWLRLTDRETEALH